MMNRDERHRIFAMALRRSLEGPLPGTDVQWEMASSDRKAANFPRTKRSDSRLAAVLIPLYPVAGQLHTLLIQRPLYNGVHSGQVSFPGGKMERDDRGPEATALRESKEEAGIEPESVEILGRLTPLYIPVSNIEVTPFVGYLPERPHLKPCEHEVVRLIEAPLALFTGTEYIKQKVMQIRGERLNVKYYEVHGSIVWGATAMLIRELVALIERESVPLF